MAKLVAAVGTPHGPMLPQEVANAPGQLRSEALMKEVRQQLEAAEPDVIIVVASDHFTNFFYNNLPQFCVGAIQEAEGPAETYCSLSHRVVHGDPKLADGIFRHGLKSGFDLSLSQELRMDHSVLVPLHFVSPSPEIPIVPLYVNGLAPPLHSARRCYKWGQTLRDCLDRWDSQQRVALLASGTFSLEVGGPQVGWTDEPWVQTVAGLLEQGDYQSLARKATEKRMTAAGNVSGELLCWVTVSGAVGDTRPKYIETDRGSGYAVWDLE